MKRTATTIFQVFVFALGFHWAAAQNTNRILAGDTMSDDSRFTVIYHNIQDVVLASGFTSTFNEYYKFDLDGDGTLDFSIRVLDVGVMGTIGRECSITPINAEGKVLKGPGNCAGSPQVWILRDADTINATGPWTGEQSMMFDYYWNISGGGHSCGLWGNNTLKKFGGLVLTTPTDTLYGWIRMSLTVTSTNMTFTVHDYAVKKRNPLSAETGIIEPARIFPNPSAGIFTIKHRYIPEGLRVFNSRGTVVKDFMFDGDECRIDLSGYPAGVYLVVSRDRSQQFHNRLVLNPSY